LYKPVQGCTVPDFQVGSTTTANDRSEGWGVLALKRADCLQEVQDIAENKCANGSSLLARPEAGPLCDHTNHPWCDGDTQSPVPFQPWNQGYDAATYNSTANVVDGNAAENLTHLESTSANYDRNHGTECYGSGCSQYEDGPQVCKHFKCSHAGGKTTVFGFLNSNEKYQCETQNDECVCQCHSDYECTLKHGSIKTKGHCKQAPEATPTDNCQIAFAKQCEDASDNFSDTYVDHSEHVENKASCFARATALRKECFKHPVDLSSFGSVNATWLADSASQQDEYEKLCFIDFSGTNAQSCPAMSDQYDTAHTHTWYLYSDHVEQASSKSACHARATELRKRCYTEQADGTGSVTASWKASANATEIPFIDSWEQVCAITVEDADGNPACTDYVGEVPEALKTHVAKESVEIKVANPSSRNNSENQWLDTQKASVLGNRDHANQQDVIQTVTNLTHVQCLNKASAIHSQCFRNGAGKVTAKWLPSAQELIVSGTANAAKDYDEKTAQELRGQNSCRITFNTNGAACPRAQAEAGDFGHADYQPAWDHQDHTEWSFDEAAQCLERAEDLYNHCFFWPGSDHELNHYIDANNTFVGRPDLFYPGSVSATYNNEVQEFLCNDEGNDCAISYQNGIAKAEAWFKDNAHSTQPNTHNVHQTLEEDSTEEGQTLQTRNRPTRGSVAHPSHDGRQWNTAV